MIAFAETLAGSPATYFMAGLITLSAVLKPFWLRTGEMGPMAIFGVVMYLVSTAIITSYRHFPGDIQAEVWTASLLAVGLIYLEVANVRGVRTELILVFVLWLIGAFAGAMVVESDLTRRLFWVFQYAGIGTLAFVCFLTLDKRDLLGHLIWGVLFIAEWIGAFQVVDCQFLHGLADQPISEGSACAQVYGWSLAPHLPTILPLPVLAWILFRWYRPRPR